MGGIFSDAVNINWFVPTWDLLVFVFFVVSSFVYGLSLGRGRSSIFLMSIYVGLAVVSNLPFLDTIVTELNWTNGFLIQILIFWLIIVLLFITLLRSPMAEYMAGLTRGLGGKGKLSQIVAFSFLNIGLLTSGTLSFFPLSLINEVLPIAGVIFYNPYSRIAWLIVPLIVMIVIQKKILKEIEGDEAHVSGP